LPRLSRESGLRIPSGSTSASSKRHSPSDRTVMRTARAARSASLAAHNRPLQGPLVFSTGPERRAPFASAPSTTVPPLVFNGFERTLVSGSASQLSAGLTTVRAASADKPLAAMARYWRPAMQTVWTVEPRRFLARLSVRVRARPSRPNVTSIPTLRRKVRPYSTDPQPRLGVRDRRRCRRAALRVAHGSLRPSPQAPMSPSLSPPARVRRSRVPFEPPFWLWISNRVPWLFLP
jgi:hypothetical protein